MKHSVNRKVKSIIDYGFIDQDFLIKDIKFWIDMDKGMELDLDHASLCIEVNNDLKIKPLRSLKDCGMNISCC